MQCYLHFKCQKGFVALFWCFFPVGNESKWFCECLRLPSPGLDEHLLRTFNIYTPFFDPSKKRGTFSFGRANGRAWDGKRDWAIKYLSTEGGIQTSGCLA